MDTIDYIFIGCIIIAVCCLLTILFILFSLNVKAHECILQGTSAKEITIYNTCKADQKNQAPSKNLNNSLLKLKIKELKIENRNLKTKTYCRLQKVV